MDLRDYLFKYNKTTVQLEKEMGYCRDYIRSYIRGRIKPSKFFGIAVERATKGLCTYDEVMAWKGYEPPYLE